MMLASTALDLLFIYLRLSTAMDMPSPPSVIPGRKGQASIVDLVIRSLWPVNGSDSKLPCKSLAEITEECRSALGFLVGSSTVRSTIYKHPEIFEKSAKVGVEAYYRLCEKFVKAHSEQ